MKQTKQFLRPLLMAIVMLVGMLMPQGAWAQELEVWEEEPISISSDASYDEIVVQPGGVLIINEGVTLTVTSSLYINENNINGFGTVINYGTIIGEGCINMMGGVLANHGHIDLSDGFGYGTFYNTGTLGGNINLNPTGCYHAGYEDLGEVDATCTHGAGTQFKCNTCYYIGIKETGEPSPHDNYDHNGLTVCSTCGQLTFDATPVGEGTAESPYQIANAGHLFWFADKVNNDYDNFKDANAVLTADIVVNDGTFADDGTFTATGASGTSTPIEWLIIGRFDLSSYGYRGTFDGQGHTISGLYANYTNSGLVGMSSEESKIKNVGVINSYFAGSMVGGICGRAFYNTEISNCYSSNVICKGGYVGGIVGLQALSDISIINCYSTASLIGVEDWAQVGGIAGGISGSTTNCYTTYGNATDWSESEINCEANVSLERFASGEIAYKLNGSVDGEGNWTAGATDGTQKWYQKLGEDGDSYPVLAAAVGNTVYEQKTIDCGGTVVACNYYNTEEEDVTLPHAYHVLLDEDEKPVFVWSEDYTSATLQLVCSRDAEHTANVEVTDEGITSEDTTPATCTTAGVRTYTATATYEGEEYTGTKEVEISATGHAYHVQKDENENPVFVWNEDYTTATLQVVCLHHAEHTANVEVTDEGITSEDTTPATCTTPGVRTYTAKATYESDTYTGTKEVEIPAGHSFVDGVCEVCHATAVAEVKIGETTTGYTDIQEAFDAAMAATGEVTVKLLADVTLTEFENNLDRGEEANRYDVALTLDLNGHNVTGNTSQAVIYVTSITLKITDEGKTGSINNCRLVVFKSDIYVDEDVTLRAEKLDWDLVNLEEDCSLENHGILYGIVVYGRGTAFYNSGSVAYAQNMGGCFENGGSFIPIWSWDTDWETDEIYCEVYINNEKLYSSKDGTVELSSEVTKAPTCTESGERTYTAAIEYVGETYTDTYSAYIDIDPDAHSFTSKTLTAEPDEHGLYAYACDREGCEGHSDYNVVKGNGEGNNIELIATTDSETGITTYSAESVIIEDGKPFYSPVEFTTRDVDMGRQFTQSIGDAVVPATIMLPFRMEAGEVSTVNPQGVRTGTKFYSFTSLDYNSANDRWEANMDIVIDDLEAYTPYMVVLTDGEEIPFGNAPVTFTQTPAEMNNITSSDGEWSFVATNEAKVWTAADFGHGEAYYGFAAGNETTPEGKFVKVGTGASIDPLRAYIMKNVQTRGSASNAPSRALTASQLPSTIGVRLNETYATGIGTLNTETGEFTFDGWYDLQGRRISEPVKNGISIKNDKKILVK